MSPGRKDPLRVKAFVRAGGNGFRVFFIIDGSSLNHLATRTKNAGEGIAGQ